MAECDQVNGLMTWLLPHARNVPLFIGRWLAPFGSIGNGVHYCSITPDVVL